MTDHPSANGTGPSSNLTEPTQPCTPPRPVARRPQHASSSPPGRRWAVLAVLGTAQLMVVLDNTIVNVALPAAQADLGFDASARQWVITAYALAFGGLLLLGGRLSDLFGRKPAFLVGLVGFAAASALGGAATGLLMLVLARAAQGVFGALLAPALLALLTTTFPAGRERARAFGVFSAIVGSGAALGLLLGGVLTEYVDWRWSMFVNTVFVIVALVGALLVLPSQRENQRPQLDLTGTVTGCAGLCCVVFGFGSAEIDGWSSPTVLGLLAGGVVLLAVFVLVQRRTHAPLLPLRIVLDRDRGGSYLARLIGATGMFAVTFFVTSYLQQVLGYSPVLTGMAFLPTIAGTVLASTTVPSLLLPRIGPRPLILTGLLVAAGALAWLAQLSTTTDYGPGIAAPLVLFGLGQGTTTAVAINTATHGVHTTDAGAASALVNVAQQLGGSLGTALLSSIAGTTAASFLATTPHTTTAAATVHGYSLALLTASTLFTAGAIACGGLLRPRATHTTA